MVIPIFFLDLKEAKSIDIKAFKNGLDLSGIKRNVDGALAFMIFALGATLVSGIIFIIALKKESTILTSSAAHCSTFAGK